MAKPSRKGASWPGYHRILWPTDFSSLARAALPHAVGLAANHEAELVLLHVIPSSALYAVPELSGAAAERFDRENRAQGKAQLRKTAAEIKRVAPDVRVHSLQAEGSPPREIVRAARRLKCDLLVLATRGRTGLPHLLMGSVAERVVRTAPCPVLTVRHPTMRLKVR